MRTEQEIADTLGKSQQTINRWLDQLTPIGQLSETGKAAGFAERDALWPSDGWFASGKFRISGRQPIHPPLVQKKLD